MILYFFKVGSIINQIGKQIFEQSYIANRFTGEPIQDKRS